MVSSPFHLPTPSVLLGFLVLAGLANSLTWNWNRTAGDVPAFSGEGEKVRGVNLGGWLILENWMTSDLCGVSPLNEQEIPDEWHYCLALGKEECLTRLTEHWSTYITEDDFKQIAALSLNTVRIPVGYWAFDLQDEPYVDGQIEYLGKALKWAKTHSLDVMVDLHGLPGSQNGLDNSGLKLSTLEWASNSSNFDRSIDALTALTKEVTKEEYQGVVKAIEVINEPMLDSLKDGGATFDQLADYYVRAYNAIRSTETISSGGAEVMVVIHDAFQAVLNWDYFFTESKYGANWTSFGLDTHIYQAFETGQSEWSHEKHLENMCGRTENLREANGNWTTIVGEFSIGVKTYCVDYQSCYNVSMADAVNNGTTSDDAVFNRQYWEIQQYIYEQAGGWIFWNWKTDAAPTWSYSQSNAEDWIPSDLSNLYSFNASSSTSCLISTSTEDTSALATTYISPSSTASGGRGSKATSSTSSATAAYAINLQMTSLLGAAIAGGLMLYA